MTNTEIRIYAELKRARNNYHNAEALMTVYGRACYGGIVATLEERYNVKKHFVMDVLDVTEEEVEAILDAIDRKEINVTMWEYKAINN